MLVLPSVELILMWVMIKLFLSFLQIFKIISKYVTDSCLDTSITQGRFVNYIGVEPIDL